MTTKQHVEMHKQHREAQSELVSWMDDVYMWRAENKQALAWLAQVEAAIHENELRLQTHSSTIDRQERHIRMHEHEIALKEQKAAFDVGSDLVDEHEQFSEKQSKARKAHAHVGESHRLQMAELKRMYDLIVKGD